MARAWWTWHVFHPTVPSAPLPSRKTRESPLRCSCGGPHKQLAVAADIQRHAPDERPAEPLGGKARLAVGHAKHLAEFGGGIHLRDARLGDGLVGPCQEVGVGRLVTQPLVRTSDLFPHALW